MARKRGGASKAVRLKHREAARRAKHGNKPWSKVQRERHRAKAAA